MQDDGRKILIHVGVKRSRSQLNYCKHFGSDTITWVVFNVQISYIDPGWWEEDAYTFGIKRSRSQMNYCKHFGSDTITWVVFNVQFSYFKHRCRMVRGTYLYILGSKVWTELCQHFGSDTITSVVCNFQVSYFIHRCRMARGRYLYILLLKGQEWTFSTLWLWHDNFSCFQSTAFIFKTLTQDGQKRISTHFVVQSKVKHTN